MNDKEKQLTMKQENFCQFYVDVEGCASEAYRLAYNTVKMKPQTINRNACEILKNNKIATRIQEIKEYRAKKSEIKRETVEKVLLDIVLADPKELYVRDEEKNAVIIKNPTQMSKNIRNAIKSIKNERGKITYEFNGKTEAARLLGCWNGWDTPRKLDIVNRNGGEIKIGFGEECNED